MAFEKEYLILAKPVPYLRITQKSKWMLAVSEAYLKGLGERKVAERKERKVDHAGSPNEYLNKRNSLLRYFEAKAEMKRECSRVGFMMPTSGCWLKFYIPMPKSWGKKKRLEKNFELHDAGNVDLDNLVKFFFDALLDNDSKIGDFRASKHWCDSAKGFVVAKIGGLPKPIGYTKASFGTDELK